MVHVHVPQGVEVRVLSWAPITTSRLTFAMRQKTPVARKASGFFLWRPVFGPAARPGCASIPQRARHGDVVDAGLDELLALRRESVGFVETAGMGLGKIGRARGQGSVGK